MFIIRTIFYFSSRDRDHGGPEGMEPDGVIEVCILRCGLQFCGLVVKYLISKNKEQIIDVGCI